MEMKDRIRQLMESNHMTQKVFASFTGISEASLSGIFKGRTKPSLGMVEAIHESIPNVSVEWLLFGKGEMYIDQSESVPTDAPTLFDNGGQLTTDNMEQIEATPRSTRKSTEGESQQKTIVKYVDKPQRRITEIRIFYDDQTWETFVPKEK